GACLVVERPRSNSDQNSSLEPTETEVEVAARKHGPRQRVSPRAARFGEARNDGPAGIAESHQLRAFIECFPCGIVESVPEKNVITDTADAHKLRMSTRDEQSDERKFRRRIGEERRKQMTFEVMDSKHRHAE